MADGGIVESALISAAIGGGTSAITGGDPLKGALMGGLMGGLGYGMFGPESAAVDTGAKTAAATQGGAQAATQTATQAGIDSLNTATGLNPTSTLGLNPASTSTSGLNLSNVGNLGANYSLTNPSNIYDLSAQTIAPGPSIAPSVTPSVTPPIENFPGKMGMNLQNLTGPQGGIKPWYNSLTTAQKLSGGAGLAGGLAGDMLAQQRALYTPDKYEGAMSKFDYDPRYFRPTFPSTPRGYADGGIATIRTIGSSGDPRRNPSPINIPNAPDWQGAQGQPTQQQMASGGITNLGSYSDGGRLLKGPGDGVSDDIPATIAGHQPARLADGEFVVPARIVSELGNGSTDAGAKRLYAMMDRVQNARRKTTGKDKFAANTRAEKYLPA